jgi:CPA1 family monovalent cation:H+ antiporter
MHAPSLSPFDAAAVLLVSAAVLGYLNRRFLPFSASVGLTFMGALASLIVIGLDAVLPGAQLSARLGAFMKGVDFSSTLLNGMLSYLLFAGALHIDWREMRRGRWPILVLSTVSTIASTVLVAFGFFALSRLMGLAVSLPWCFVFGALISPTDPVAVFAVLRTLSVPPRLKATLAAESLFNDGIAVVLFGIALAFASGGEVVSLGAAAWTFVREAGGGVVLGGVVGGVGYLFMRDIDDYNVEVMITLAVVTGGYALAHVIDVSGPVAMAVAGLIIGNAAVGHAMSATTRDYLLKFWAVIDEVLNAVLFLLIGLEFVTVAHDGHLLLTGAAAIPLVLLARLASVAPPLLVLPGIEADRLTVTTLVWGGLRGGLSVAMALSLGQSAASPVILVATYVVVLFAVLIQGGTIERVIRKVTARQPAQQGSES